MNDRIEVGDFVAVNFNGAQLTLCHRAEVIYIPNSAYDCWIFKDTSTGAIHDVTEGCTVTLLEKANG